MRDDRRLAELRALIARHERGEVRAEIEAALARVRVQAGAVFAPKEARNV